MPEHTKQQMMQFVEGLFEVRRPVSPELYYRMRYQRWLLREAAMFWPNEPLVDVVSEVVAPMMALRYPH